MNNLLYVGLDSADMLVTGIDAFIIRKSELQEKLNSFKNCYSRVKGTEREGSVLENLQKLMFCGKHTDFVTDDVRTLVYELYGRVSVNNIKLSLEKSTDGQDFLSLLDEIHYIVSTEIIYTNLVMMKFKSLYHAVGRQINNASLRYDFIDFLQSARQKILEFLRVLDKINDKISDNMTGRDETAPYMSGGTGLKLNLSLQPDLAVLTEQVEVLAGEMDKCMSAYYDEKLESGQVRKILKKLGEDFVRLKSLIPLGGVRSEKLLRNIERRLNLCVSSFQNVGFIDSSRELFLELLRESQLPENTGEVHINASSFHDARDGNEEDYDSGAELLYGNNSDVDINPFSNDDLQVVVFKPQ